MKLISKSLVLSPFLISNLVAQNNVKPNIILILVDDLGFGDLSCQNQAKDVRTPNIDKLFYEGLQFTNFYANSPVSSPSRAALMTGRYPDLVGVPGLIRTREKENWGYLSKDAILIPELLKQKKYHSAIIGKWNLGLTTPNTPRERGFDYFHGFLDDMMEDYYTHLRCNINYMRENERVVNPKGHATDIFTDWAIDYVNKRKSNKNPFFLYLAYNAPHSPLQPPAEWLKKVKTQEPLISETRAKLVALIEHLDFGIGQLFKTLESNGQLENTLIIFTSDNGGDARSEANNNPFRGAKQDMYEGGIHVAASFYWKNRIIPSKTKNFMMLSDILPTLCDLTGVAIKHPIDGISILPTLKGEKQTTDDRMVFWMRREGTLKYGGNAYYASRFKEFKLIQNSPYEPLQFFNIETDPKEQYPIMKSASEKYTNLFNGLMEHIRVSGAVPWEPMNNSK